MEIRKKFGKLLKKARLKRGFSQEKLAEISKLYRTYISSLECGKRNISLVNLEKLSKALKIKLSELLKNL